MADLPDDYFQNATDADLKKIVESGSWGGFSYWDVQHARREIDARLTAQILKGVKVGDVIDFVRHGTPPQSGKSFNHRDQTEEDGLSVYLLDPETEQPHYVGWYFDISKRPAYRGRGEVVGFGSDGEPLVHVHHIKRDATLDRSE